MLFRRQFHEPIVSGAVTRTVRRWRRPQARAGGRYRLEDAGSIEVDTITETSENALTEDDARRSGFDSVAALLEAIPPRQGGGLYRVDFHYVGQVADPRAALAADAELTPSDRAELAALLERMDARSHRPWTRQTLEQIEGSPGTVSHVLAAAIGLETAPFKANVRKLKKLGLTISLETGYELSPRGRTLAAHLRSRS